MRRRRWWVVAALALALAGAAIATRAWRVRRAQEQARRTATELAFADLAAKQRAVAEMAEQLSTWRYTPRNDPERERILAELEKQYDPPPESDAPPLDLGPDPKAPRERREEAVLALMAGLKPTARLPLVPTDPGEDFDPDLREQIVGPPPCTCEPGDPMCSCP